MSRVQKKMDIKFNFSRNWTVLLVLICFCGLPVSDAVDCLQCNVFSQGTTNTCNNPRFMTGCYACLKTLTRVKMHDRWGDYKVSEAMSRYCIKKSATALIRDAGCYYQKNNGGYTERCYCYEDNCNGAGTVSTSFGVFFLAVAAKCFL